MLPAFVPPCREVSGSHNSQAEAFKEIPGSHHPGFQNSKESTFWELYCGKKSGQSLPFVDLDAQGIFPSTTQERQEAWSSWTAGELCSLNTNHGASTGHLHWLLYPNHPEFFSVMFSDEETERQNSLPFATKAIPMDFVQCFTSISIPCALLLREEVNTHMEAEGTQLELYSRWTRSCWPPRTERLKPEFQPTQTNDSLQQDSFVSTKKLLKTALLQSVNSLQRIFFFFFRLQLSTAWSGIRRFPHSPRILPALTDCAIPRNPW